MSDPQPATTGRIFMSYRRQDSAYPAGWLYDRLADRFGHDQVFKDIDSIDLGEDFGAAIWNAVGGCDVVLALIGPGWLSVTGPDGNRRLDDAQDFVRIEIEAAIARNVLLVPILVGGVSMPPAADLPPSLAPLVRRQALELSPNRFAADTAHLLDVIDRTLNGSQPDGSPVGLPRPLTELVGRESEVEELSTLLQSGSARLVTLTGPGGSGKTRLAIECAHAVARRFDEVYFVSLATVVDLDVMLVEIGEAMGFPSGRHTIEGLVAEIGHKAILLVLDNLEQLEAADSVVSDLVICTDRLLILATSRRTLHVLGEREYSVDPLGLPRSDELDAAKTSGAVQMFVQHASMINPQFELTAANVGHVVAVCRHLDGLPLALELAAARSKILTPAGIATRLDNALEFTQHGSSRPSRQRTLRGTIAWSYELLEATEQDLFCRLSTLSGGGDLEAVEAIAGPSRSDTADALSVLVDASLVTVDHGNLGEPRFGMLETIRTFAWEMLADGGQLEATLLAHANHYKHVAIRMEELGGTSNDLNDLREAERMFGLELDNMRAALRWTLGGEAHESSPELAWIGIQMCAALGVAWGSDGSLPETVHWMTRAVESAGETTSAELAACYWTLAFYLPQLDGNYKRGYSAAKRCVELERELGDKNRLTIALILLGTAEQFVVGADSARATLTEAEEVAQLCGEWELAFVAFRRATVEMLEGNLERAIELVELSLELQETSDDQEALFETRALMARLSLLNGDAALARDQLSSQLEFALEFGMADLLTDLAEDYGAALAATGDHAEAARLLGAAEADRARRDALRHPFVGPRIDAPYLKARDITGEVEWEREYEVGRTMTVKEALESTRLTPERTRPPHP